MNIYFVNITAQVIFKMQNIVLLHNMNFKEGI